MQRNPTKEWELVASGSDDGLTANETDLANAERFVVTFGGRVLHCKALGGWHHYDGKRYRRDTTGEVMRLAKAVVRRMFREANEELSQAQAALACIEQEIDACIARESDPPELRDRQRATQMRIAAAVRRVEWARRSHSRERLVALVDLAASEQGIAVAAGQFDADPWFFNVANGTVDLRTGKLMPHDPAHLISKLAPFDYDPQATCPTWTAFLEDILPDPDVRGYLQAYAGYAMTGVVRDRMLPFLVGEGANGKSVFLRVLQSVCGDYAATTAPELLLSKSGEAHPTEVADLCGVRLAVCSEVRMDRVFDEAQVKRLTGNDIIKARWMRQDFFQFAPTFKLILAANHMPRVLDRTESFWDRVRIVPFPRRIPSEKRDTAMPERLLAEAPGILRWALEGCMRWQREGLPVPAAVVAASEAYRIEQDWARRFVGECCERGADLRCSARDLYAAYKEWATSSAEDVVKQKVFGAALKALGLRASKSNCMVWHGIALTARGGTIGTIGTVLPFCRNGVARELDDDLDDGGPSQSSPSSQPSSSLAGPACDEEEVIEIRPGAFQP